MKKLLGSAACFFVSLILLSFITFAQEKINSRLVKQGIWNEREIEYVDRQIAVKIKDGVQQDNVLPLLNQHHATLTENFDKLRWGLIEVPEGVDIFPVIAALKKSNMFEVVQPNIMVYPGFEPNDTYYLDGHQWALKNWGQSPPGGADDADIDAPEAWDITMGSSSKIIAILDSGIPLDRVTLALCHPDLDDPNKIILGADCTNEIDGNVRDSMGHGTHVTGIIAAKTNNNTGIAGIAGGCKAMVIQVFSPVAPGGWIAVKNGTIYAVDHRQGQVFFYV